MISNIHSHKGGSGGIPIITDPEFKRAPTNLQDSVACLAWGKEENPNVLLSSTWDGHIFLYYVSPRHTDAVIETVEDIFEAHSRSVGTPCISLDWMRQDKKMIAGSIDGTIMLIDPNSLEIQTIGKHEDAVKGVYYVEEMNTNLVISLSYDRTMKFWDLRTQNPIKSFDLGAKAVCSDLVFPNIAIGLSNKKLLIFDITTDLFDLSPNLSNHYVDSPLGFDSLLSAISISKENTIGIATYDGRSNLSNFELRRPEKARLENIVTFKAHKIGPGQAGNTGNHSILYPIHAVGLHPRNKNTYFTAGGDGCVNFWDIPARNKLAFLTCFDTPITAAKYSPNGKLLAYAYGYDWAKGIEGSKTIKPKLHVHTMQLYEVASVSQSL